MLYNFSKIFCQKRHVTFISIFDELVSVSFGTCTRFVIGIDRKKWSISYGMYEPPLKCYVRAYYTDPIPDQPNILYDKNRQRSLVSFYLLKLNQIEPKLVGCSSKLHIPYIWLDHKNIPILRKRNSIESYCWIKQKLSFVVIVRQFTLSC